MSDKDKCQEGEIGELWAVRIDRAFTVGCQSCHEAARMVDAGSEIAVKCPVCGARWKYDEV